MFDPDVSIATARLTLRPFGPQDDARIRSIVKSGARFLPPGAPVKTTGVDRWLRHGVHELHRSGQGVHLAMTDTDGLVVGAISLFKTSWTAGTTEVGYGVHPLYRGRGFATEAVRGLTAWAFEAIGLRRVDLTANLDNVASLRVACKAGFTWEGVLRDAVVDEQGTHDLVMFGLLREDGGMPPNALPRTELRTERLLLRPQAPQDAPHLTASALDPLSQAYTGVPRDYTEEHARAYIAQSERLRMRGAGAVWTAEELGSGRYAANVDLRDLDWANKTAEVGYMTAPWARGHGYAGEAVTALARWLFERHGFTRLQLRAFVANAASQRVAEKAGFVREGVARASIAGSDLVVYSLIPSDLA
ncbi:Protein N-acetyltransferase, RimJ/RimL family [Nonomuraea solani]|uniref:Protein N-acetyltransferase, RimJ/RimL family n=1 Tax=Nonomuraea solani TaxID=1144553 RepID=A0A1H6DQB2_9ACTN|nr:GNAT family N-acetyltransferase [Nonomuraea solani]SEG87552.1 Protein N-acetyltransferase, RimJ/RimL family [Nonomuraea solani]